MGNSVKIPYESSRILFLSEFLPSHHGHGGNVYPHFVLAGLRSQGVDHVTLVPDAMAAFGKPWCSHSCKFKSDGWVAIGSTSVSTKPKHWLRFFAQRARTVLKKLARRKIAVSVHDGPKTPKFATANSESEKSFRPRLAKWLEDYLVRLEPHVLIVNFPYLIDSLSDQILQRHYVVTLTHELIHERVKAYQEQNWNLDFQPLSHSQEKRLLSQSQLVTAISEDDRKKLIKLLPDNEVVTCFPPIYESSHERVLATTRDPHESTFLFIGSGAVHNRETMRWILDEVWPKVSARYPKMKFHIAGSVCQHAQDFATDSSVKLLGRVPEVIDAYRDADIAFAFAISGAGVKMKLLEAIRFGVPALVTEETLRGLPDGANEVFPMVGSASDVIEIMFGIAERNEALSEIQRKQQDWAKTHLRPENLIQPLLDCLPIT